MGREMLHRSINESDFYFDKEPFTRVQMDKNLTLEELPFLLQNTDSPVRGTTVQPFHVCGCCRGA